MNNNINNVWKGFKESRVYKIVEEDKNVKSFYLNFDDGSKMPEFIPGQFIAIRVKMEDGSYSKTRQYTLSEKFNENYYRVSIKREEEGNVSKILCDEISKGDTIEITVPIGKFVLKDSTRPLVLLGGGIGITPMLTMAQAAENRDIYLIYSIPNSNNYSFKEEIDELTREKNINKTTIFTRPFDNEVLGKDYDMKGRITKEWMESNLPKDGDFYFCGPVPFMKSVYQNLIAMGVEKEQINYELFGPGADITK